MQGESGEGRAMRVSDWALQRLADEGITHAFTVYGGAISELMDAFTRQDRIQYVVCQHEQAAVFCAEGFAKTKGVPGLVIVTSGPGGGNIVTGLQNCFYDSVPLIAICGQVTSKFIRPHDRMRQLGFQEAPLVDIARPITKYVCQPRTGHDAMHALNRAIRAAIDGRPGPALIDLPTDVQKMELPADECPEETRFVSR